MSAALLAAASVLACGASHAQADREPETPNRLRVSGFGTFGLTHADAPARWGYRRDIAQPWNDGGTRADIDSRVGVQANYALTSQFELVTQLVAKRRAPDNASDNIEWAFLAYRPRSDVTVRLGRVNLDVFLMSEYRDVGFAYPFARPPVDFYGVLPSNLDGGDVSKSWNIDGVLWRVKAFGGQSSSGDRGAVPNGAKLRPVYGAMLSRDTGNLLLRATLSQTVITRNPSALDPLLSALGGVATLPVSSVAAEASALRDRLDLTSGRITYLAFGANYEDNGWIAMAEVTRITGQAAVALNAGYASLGRRLGAVTVYGTLSSVRSTAGVAPTPAWQAALTPIVGGPAAAQVQALGSAAVAATNQSRSEQHTVSLGARWDVRPDAALKLQWDRISVQPHGSGLLWANGDPQGATANVVSLSLDFIF